MHHNWRLKEWINHAFSRAATLLLLLWLTTRHWDAAFFKNTIIYLSIFAALFIIHPLPASIIKSAGFLVAIPKLLMKWLGKVFVQLLQVAPQKNGGILAVFYVRGTSQIRTPLKYDVLWPLIGTILLLGSLGYLEWKEAFYFTQDDSHSSLMPNFILAARGLFDEGSFPTWNGYALNGAPTTSLGYYTLTYPLLYLSYAIARFFAGNEFLTLEVSAWLHFLGGYYFSYRALRELNVSRPLSVAASLTFILCGYNLINGRSWSTMIPAAMWIPALGWSLALLVSRERLSWRWIFGSGAALGIFFHGAHQQFPVYGLMFWSIGCAWAALCRISYKPADIRIVLPIAAALCIGLAIASPLLAVVYLESRNIPRFAIGSDTADGTSIAPRLQDMLLLPRYYPVDLVYNSAAVFIWAFFIGCFVNIVTIGRYGFNRCLSLHSTFTIAGCAALYYAFGQDSFFWQALSKYPPFSGFQWLSRILPILIFFMTLGGAWWLDRTLRQLKFYHTLSYVISVIALGFVLNGITYATFSRYTWADHPYPDIRQYPELQVLQAQGFTTKSRGHPMAYWRSPAMGYSLTFKQSYPSIYQVPVMTGYDGALEEALTETTNVSQYYSRNKEQYYRDYSVEWIGVSKLKGEDTPINAAEMQSIQKQAKRVINSTYMDIYFIADEQTTPMVHRLNARYEALEYKINNNGISIKLPPQGNATKESPIIAAFIYRPWFRAWDNHGKEIGLSADSVGRILVDAPSNNASRIEIRYSPPWHYGLIASMFW